MEPSYTSLGYGSVITLGSALWLIVEINYIGNFNKEKIGNHESFEEMGYSVKLE